MKTVFFEPWIGNRYGKDNSVFDKKVLVIGDSHYCEESCSNCGSKEHKPRCGNFTTEVVNDYLDVNHSATWKSTFSKFMNSFADETKNEEYSREDLWASISFYNYLQVAAGNTSRETNQFDYNGNSDRESLVEVISALEPDVIISWGNSVWDALPDDLGWGEATVNEQFSDCCLNYPFKEGKIKLVGITHPSTSYKSAYWSNVFTELGLNK